MYPDAVDDRLESRQQRTPPVRRDVAEEPVFDLVPLARAGWRMAYLHGQAGLVGEPLELVLPGTRAIPTGVSPSKGNTYCLKHLRQLASV